MNADDVFPMRVSTISEGGEKFYYNPTAVRIVYHPDFSIPLL